MMEENQLTKGKGDVTIRIKYDDNPGYAGEASFDQLQLLVKNGEKENRIMEKKLKQLT